MTIHAESHPNAGESVSVKMNTLEGLVEDSAIIEDWWDRVSGESWMNANGNPAALIYALRVGVVGLPMDNEVVYCKIGSLGHLIHVSEITS